MGGNRSYGEKTVKWLRDKKIERTIVGKYVYVCIYLRVYARVSVCR